MFGKLPELLSRDFAIGYFLPAAAFLVAIGAISNAHGHNIPNFVFSNPTGINVLIETTVFGIVSWFGGIILLSLNRSLIRILEGYGTFNPLKILMPIRRGLYRRMQEELESLDDKYAAHLESGQPFSEKESRRRNQLTLHAAVSYPDDERYVMPTSFGNIIRSFETYSRVMYGIDAIPGWYRLLESFLPPTKRTSWMRRQ
ncbi:MAG: hypothetical protein IPK16_20565 [Anaerolineales bacterium]|nr:hypothetical protein [Anaerolineales bacterium]